MTTRFEITDPAIKQALLVQFVCEVNSGSKRLDQFIDMGVDPNLIDLLRTDASISDICRVMALSQAKFEVSFDDVGLMRCFEQLSRVSREDEVKEYLARHGASTELLKRWYSLSHQEADTLRADLSMGLFRGRPRLPDPQTRDDIHEAWLSMPANQLERDAYFRLHQSFSSFSVSVLHRIVHEHDTLTFKSKPPKPLSSGPDGLRSRKVSA